MQNLILKAVSNDNRMIYRTKAFLFPAHCQSASSLASVFTPPVKEGEDPFRSDNFPENLGYHIQMKDGVVYVYADKAAAARGEPKDLPYPNLEVFIDDMNFLLALIAQGPV